jgi:hypothetical protein
MSRTNCPSRLAQFSAAFYGLEPCRRGSAQQHIFQVAPDDQGESLKQIMWHWRTVFIFAVTLGRDVQSCSHLSRRPPALIPQPMHASAQVLVEDGFFVIDDHPRRIGFPRPTVLRHGVLTMLDGLSNHSAMSEITLNWRVVDDIAAELGAQKEARAKWRQAGRGVPAEWKIRITQAMMARGIPIALSDFDQLPENPGRIAA